MKTSRWLVLIFAAACGGTAPTVTPETVTAEPGALKADTAEIDYNASYCELFIDKIEPIEQEDAEYVQLYLKTHNDRLDGNLVEVGFRNQFTGTAPANTVVFYDWRNDVAAPFSGASDYFSISIFVEAYIASNLSHEGAFYAKTDKNVYYWVKPDKAGTQNFFIDENAYNQAENVFGGGDRHVTASPTSSAPTQQPAFSYYNVNDCF
jgi:hypothetical protein